MYSHANPQQKFLIILCYWLCEFWLTVAGWADGEVLADQPRETGTGADGKGVPEAVIWICLFDGQLQLLTKEMLWYCTRIFLKKMLAYFLKIESNLAFSSGFLFV